MSGLGPAVGSQPSLTRRALFSRIGGGFGTLGLAGVLADAGMLVPALASPPATVQNTEGAVLNHPLAPRPPHFPARAKRVIFLFMNGGPVARRHVRPQTGSRRVTRGSLRPPRS